MSIIVGDVSYRYPNQQNIFEHISFSVCSGQKASIIGNNGTGKSTLLRLIAGTLTPLSGSIHCASQPYYIAQQAHFETQTVSEALGVREKINALDCISNGSTNQVYYDQLEGDWDIVSRCGWALDFWGLRGIEMTLPLAGLSGGERNKVHLAGLLIHQPAIVLLDEPSNHLDHHSRQKLYDYVMDSKATIVVVSHDVTLLNLLDVTYQISEKGISAYGGNYSFYKDQKVVEDMALEQQINAAEGALRLVRKKAQEVRERQEKRASQGEKSKRKGGLAKIVLNARGSMAENSSAKLKEKHTAIVDYSREALSQLRQQQQNNRKLKIDFVNAALHGGKVLVEAADVNFSYSEGSTIWQSPFNIEIRSGERIHILGNNGTGKSTLVKLLVGQLSPSTGQIKRAGFSYIYLDQQYSMVNKDISVLALAYTHNSCNLLDHEIKLRLNRALLPQDMWDKNCLTLSGGEQLRLYLCCLMISNQVPDMFVLDEPTNNLDISSLEILAGTIRDYKGTVLVISHDRNFVQEIGITRSIELFN